MIVSEIMKNNKTIKNRVLILPVVSFILFSFLTGCNSFEVRKENLTRPSFVHQASYRLNQSIVDFFTDYKLVRHNSIKPIVRAISYDWFNAGEFEISRDKKSKFMLSTDYNRGEFSLRSGEEVVLNITRDAMNDDIYSIIYKGSTYTMQVAVKKSFLDQIKNSTLVTISTPENKEVLYIFKEFHYFVNILEVYEDLQNITFDPAAITSLAVITNELMKAQFIKYK